MVAAKTEKPATALLGERLREAVELPMDTWKDARKLAKQLEDKPILPLLGAGVSFDCGMETAKPIAKRMYNWYVDNVGASRAPSDLEEKQEDLGAVADAVYAVGDQAKVVEALALGSTTEWPEAEALPKHFCSYRVLARLAREGVIGEAITLNYDSCFERGLDDEGFQFEPWDLHGRKWVDHATVVTDGAGHMQLDPRGQLVLTKAHGCAAAYQRIAARVEEAGEKAMSEELRKKLKSVEDSIVIRRGQLLDWRTDFWARDLFSDRARRHVILLLGVSGQDPVIHIALTRVLEEVHRHLGDGRSKACDAPRVVAIDRYPNTVALTSLIHEGCGRRPPTADAVTSIEVPEDGSMTAVLTALAVEMLARRLYREAGFLLPNSPQARVVSTMAVVPASLRWTYFLERRRSGANLYQRANLEKVGEKGYVPLRSDSKRVAESLRVREWLRGRLQMKTDETIDEALSGFGFIASPRHGRAFMPLGITGDELRAATSAELVAATVCFSAPPELEPVLVARSGGEFIGRAVLTGKMVKLP